MDEFNHYDGERFYKKVPIPVSDDEYEQIRAMRRKHSYQNKIAEVLFYIAIAIYIVGILLVLTLTTQMGFFSVLEFLFGLVAVAVVGSMILGLLEIIEVLDHSNN